MLFQGETVCSYISGEQAMDGPVVHEKEVHVGNVVDNKLKEPCSQGEVGGHFVGSTSTHGQLRVGDRLRT